ncbi:hypothetical protein Syun_012747 [Stephania yunnanensis]|uniref:N(6)-L-threonylcarbamoyladenine synthase n=1 Tax=Stephania yunnanensis TaxID=152371 RepID=A0AAP0PGP0_9MAGN
MNNFLVLVVLAGHNLLILASDLGHYVQLGTTIDDAIGEAYDKIARWLGLDVRRAGPALEELAQEGNEESIKFRPFVQLMCLQIGFSDPDVPISSASCQDRTIRADIAASFQVVSGGVASNQYLMIRLNQIVEQNGVMIAWTGIEHFTWGRYDPPPPADEPDDALLCKWHRHSGKRRYRVIQKHLSD